MLEIEWNPQKITTRKGRVLVEGPSHAELSIDPDSADVLADRLHQAARRTRRER
jgi:hypothetical protein